jgi:hypothetical protein
MTPNDIDIDPLMVLAGFGWLVVIWIVRSWD